MRLTLQNAAQDTGAADKKENRPLTDEERKQQRKERIAAMTPREKFLYFLDYYKIPVIAAAAAILFVVLIVRDIRGNLPYGFDAELLNAQLWDTEAFAEEFAAEAEIDLSVEACVIDTDAMNLSSGAGVYDQTALYAAEKLMVRIAAAEIDVLAGDEELFLQYAAGGSYLDLREVLSDEELAFFSPYLFEASAEVEEGIFSDPAPLGIRLDDAARLNALNAYPDHSAIVGIVANTKHTDRAVAFLKFLFENND